MSEYDITFKDGRKISVDDVRYNKDGTVDYIERWTHKTRTIPQSSIAGVEHINRNYTGLLGKLFEPKFNRRW